MCLLLQDAWSDSEGHVSLDSQQDYELIGTQQKPDGYYLLFKRPFSTCDPRDYLIEVRGVFLPRCAKSIFSVIRDDLSERLSSVDWLRHAFKFRFGLCFSSLS